jgi:hypothetical protein
LQGGIHGIDYGSYGGRCRQAEHDTATRTGDVDRGGMSDSDSRFDARGINVKAVNGETRELEALGEGISNQTKAD